MRRCAVGLLVVVTACGGVVVQTDPAIDRPVSTSSTRPTPPGSTAERAPSETTATTPAPSTTISDRPLAPDFTLALGDGGVYTLSEGVKPVYMVFWAEW